MLLPIVETSDDEVWMASEDIPDFMISGHLVQKFKGYSQFVLMVALAKMCNSLFEIDRGRASSVLLMVGEVAENMLLVFVLYVELVSTCLFVLIDLKVLVCYMSNQSLYLIFVWALLFS